MRGVEKETWTNVKSQPYLLVVLDAHADGVDQNGDHDASVKVLALHDAPQFHPDLVPQLLASLLRTTTGVCTFMALFVLPFSTGLYTIPVWFLHSSLFGFVTRCIANWSHPIRERQRCRALRAAICGGGSSEGHRLSGRSMAWFVVMGTWRALQDARWRTLMGDHINQIDKYYFLTVTYHVLTPLFCHVLHVHWPSSPFLPCLLFLFQHHESHEVSPGGC